MGIWDRDYFIIDHKKRMLLIEQQSPIKANTPQKTFQGKKKRGRAGSSAWLKSKLLAGERESDKKVRDARYNPKEFRIDLVSRKRPWASRIFVNSGGTTKSSNTNTKKYQGVNKRVRINTVDFVNSYGTTKSPNTNTKKHQGVNKRERIKTVKITPKISIVKASLICIFFMFLTFSATMLILATKPTLLNAPYQTALKIINIL